MTEEKKKVGRPSKFDGNEEYFCKEVEKLLTIGVCYRDIAWYMGISEDSLARWREKHPDFAEAIKRGEAAKRIALLTAMYQNAIHRKQPSVQIFLAKNWLGMKDIAELGGSSDSPIQIRIVRAKKEDQGNGNGGNGHGGESKP